MKQLVLLLFLLTSVSAQAAELASVEEAKKLANDVMVQVSKGNLQKGLEMCKPYLIIPEAEFDVMLNNIKMQKSAIAQRFGETVGVEFIREEMVGVSLMKITHIQKFDKHAMRWEFHFYKPRNSWVLNTFKYDDKIHYLFSH